jgi:hypothetical protein
MKDGNKELIFEVNKIITSLNQRLVKNKYELRKLSEENRIIKRELSTCIKLKNLIVKEIV